VSNKRFVLGKIIDILKLEKSSTENLVWRRGQNRFEIYLTRKPEPITQSTITLVKLNIKSPFYPHFHIHPHSCLWLVAHLAAEALSTNYPGQGKELPEVRIPKQTRKQNKN